MGRIPRIHYPGSIHHVYTRGNGGRDIFFDAMDYERFLDELSQMRPKGLVFLAYCLMPNHFHLLVRVAEVALSEIMHDLLGRYSRYYNDRRESFGSLFQARFKDDLVDTEAYVMNSMRYIHLNPVTARIVSAPEEWAWSGHRAILGKPDRLMDVDAALAFFDADQQHAREAYLQFMKREIIRPSAQAGAAAASQSLAVIAADCEQVLLARPGDIASKAQARPIVRARRLFVRRALDAGFSRKEISAFLHCTNSAISKMLQARESFNQSFNSAPGTPFNLLDGDALG